LKVALHIFEMDTKQWN